MPIHLCTAFCARYGCPVLGGPQVIEQPAIDFTTYQGRHRPEET